MTKNDQICDAVIDHTRPNRVQSRDLVIGAIYRLENVQARIIEMNAIRVYVVILALRVAVTKWQCSKIRFGLVPHPCNPCRI